MRPNGRTGTIVSIRGSIVDIAFDDAVPPIDRMLRSGQDVTVSCAEGDEEYVYEGRAEFEVRNIDTGDIPQTRTKIMVNLANPAAAFRWRRLPTDGVGLARMEFIIGNLIKIHPMALVHFDKVEDKEARAKIERLTRAFSDKSEFFVDTLARGIARFLAPQGIDSISVSPDSFLQVKREATAAESETDPTTRSR